MTEINDMTFIGNIVTRTAFKHIRTTELDVVRESISSDIIHYFDLEIVASSIEIVDCQIKSYALDPSAGNDEDIGALILDLLEHIRTVENDIVLFKAGTVNTYHLITIVYEQEQKDHYKPEFLSRYTEKNTHISFPLYDKESFHFQIRSLNTRLLFGHQFDMNIGSPEGHQLGASNWNEFYNTRRPMPTYRAGSEPSRHDRQFNPPAVATPMAYTSHPSDTPSFYSECIRDLHQRVADLEEKIQK